MKHFILKSYDSYYIYKLNPNFSMKSKYLFLIVALLASVVIVSGCIGQSSEPAVTLNQGNIKFTTYEDPIYGVKISYPEEWKSPENANAIFMFASSKGYSINLQIQLLNDDAENPMTLDKYTTLARKDVELYSTDTIPPVFEKTVLSGLPAYKVTYNARIGNIEARTTQAWTINDGKVYVLTYGGPMDAFDSALGNRIINSFEISGEKAVQLNL